ncbi:16S rRNA (guanine(527)-N(7))-methyltransferase RsmG [Pseudochryseolinea flava]|uniref:Ribosomal RNA small subunit methyltransferase G n=1 Tax=Pseudochryseolinea flava TaxID=2059302 RepID=A0A364Y0N6_9BACT|nr:16S rRNA (guanine(527)-N(7))-methyltransferase RsmG [Pseudochryseolinea flava]RAV99832.1 16S rRNA (guanine(527)-N(7))-methyltransferase RsmG [Pseudochryseolinea flava]
MEGYKVTITYCQLITSQIIFDYFPDLTAKQKDQFGKLFNLYRDWNDKINVVSRKDIENLYVNHVLHSLGIAKVMSFNPGAEVLDVGTGGGFPGIPLAIMFPETKFHLVDSIGKKITVVNGVAEGVGIKNVRGEQIRAEQIKGEYDFIVSRAVTRLKEFYGWINKKVKTTSTHTLDNGILYLKGGDLDEELAEVKRIHQVFNLSDFFKEEFFETKKVVYVPL